MDALITTDDDGDGHGDKDEVRRRRKMLIKWYFRHQPSTHTKRGRERGRWRGRHAQRECATFPGRRLLLAGTVIKLYYELRRFGFHSSSSCNFSFSFGFSFSFSFSFGFSFRFSLAFCACAVGKTFSPLNLWQHQSCKTNHKKKTHKKLKKTFQGQRSVSGVRVSVFVRRVQVKELEKVLMFYSSCINNELPLVLCQNSLGIAKQAQEEEIWTA